MCQDNFSANLSYPRFHTQLNSVAPVFCLLIFNFKWLLASEARQAKG